jgi:hypothetical protein
VNGRAKGALDALLWYGWRGGEFMSCGDCPAKEREGEEDGNETKSEMSVLPLDSGDVKLCGRFFFFSLSFYTSAFFFAAK